MTIQP